MNIELTEAIEIAILKILEIQSMNFNIFEVTGIAILSYIFGIIKMARKNVELKEENKRLQKEKNTLRMVINKIAEERIIILETMIKK